MRPRDAFALALVALFAVHIATGCSIDVDPLGAPEAIETVALEIAGPHEALVYNVADDEDPGCSGIQLTLRVDVAQDDIEAVDLLVRDIALTDVVTADLAGRRAAFFDVTLVGTDTQVIAAADTDAPQSAPERVEVQAILRAVQ